MADDTAPEVREATKAAIASVSFFIINKEVLDKISDESGQAAIKAGNIATLLSQFIGIAIGERLASLTEQVKQEPIPDNKATLSAMKERGFDIAKLALLLPLLINDEARKYLASFIQGLIGAETLDKIEKALKIVGIVLAGVFAAKVLKQVADAVTIFVRLARLTALLFGLTQATTDINEKERKKLDRRKEAEKRNRDKRRSNRRKKIERIKKIKDVVGNIKKGILIGGPIGIAAGIVSGIVVNSLIDYIVSDDEKIADIEDKAETEIGDDGEPVVPDIPNELSSDGLSKIILNNLIKELSFGLLTKDSLDNLSKVLKGDQATIQQNQQAIEGSVGTMGAEIEAVTPPLTETPTAEPIKPFNPSTQQRSTTMGGRGSQSPIRPKPVTPPIVPQPTNEAVPEPTTSTTGATLSTTSVDVSTGRKDLTRATSSVFIDNSSIAVSPEEPSYFGSSINYSLSVGR